jgi:hypothetical protein
MGKSSGGGGGGGGGIPKEALKGMTEGLRNRAQWLINNITSAKKTISSANPTNRTPKEQLLKNIRSDQRELNGLIKRAKARQEAKA